MSREGNEWNILCRNIWWSDPNAMGKMIHVDSKLKVRYTFLYGFMLKFYVMICFYFAAKLLFCSYQNYNFSIILNWKENLDANKSINHLDSFISVFRLFQVNLQHMLNFKWDKNLCLDSEWPKRAHAKIIIASSNTL